MKQLDQPATRSPLAHTLINHDRSEMEMVYTLISLYVPSIPVRNGGTSKVPA